ncbi:PepSY domain-containing protein [Streptomyces sp. NPDC047725]|uniref:PepSY domain-containing protein n=1 Tax=Streptomyces sp. NPDC047725 TaxID=3365487 RepID=UPI003714D3A8
MKRNIVIAAVTAAALVAGGTATALTATGGDRPDTGTARHADDARAADGRDDADDRDDGADDRDDDVRVAVAKVTAADAVASALRERPGTAVSAELDGDDDGDRERAVWEVDVLAGDGAWHTVRVDPATGAVLGSRAEDEDDTAEVRAALKGTSVGAAEAARAAAGHGTVTSVELDEDGCFADGRPAWEVETRSPGKAERDWRVDPRTGEVTAGHPHGPDSDDSRSDDSGSDDSGPDDD